MVTKTLIAIVAVCLSLAASAETTAQAGMTVRVSVQTGGGQVDCGTEAFCNFLGGISGDGQSIAFGSNSSDFGAGAGSGFVHEMSSGETALVSLDTNGQPANLGASAISTDGRFVALGGAVSIFVRDRLLGTTTQANLDNSGNPLFVYTSNMSSSGRYVVWVDAVGAVFVRDMQAAAAEQVSTSCAGDGPYEPAISGDGRFVAFVSACTNLVPSDTNGSLDLFLRDRELATTVRINEDSMHQTPGCSGGTPCGSFPSLSADGRFILFGTQVTSFVPPGTVAGGYFVRDRQTGETTERVSESSTGAQVTFRTASISGSGRYVVFDSDSPDAVAGDTNGRNDVFVHDTQTRITARVSIASDGSQGNLDSMWASISSDGRRVAFTSRASNLVANDTNETSDVFVRDLGDADGDGEWDSFDFSTDSDGDLIANPVESKCGADPLNAASVPERTDTPGDDDGDSLVNEVLPVGAEAYDCDGDGYKGVAETSMFSGGGDGDQDPCGTNGWPSDLVPGGFQPNTLNIADLGSFVTPVRRIGTSPGDQGFNARWDLVPGSVIGPHIAVTDIAATVVGASGYPPMFGGLRAYGRACPWAP